MKIIAKICVIASFIIAISTAEAQTSKRGLGSGGAGLTNAVNGVWGYDWSITLPSGGLNGEFIPLVFQGANAACWQNRFDAIDANGAKYVLGFNEPERADQANMTVANAITQWKNLSDKYGGTSVKLVSPAVSNNAAGKAWLADFMD